MIAYVYGCQRRFGSRSPERCDIFCQFACGTPQLELYSLTVSGFNGREQSALLRIGQSTRIPCQLEVITIEAQGLDGNRNELRLPSVITGQTQPTLPTESMDTDPTSTSTSVTTSETEDSASTTMSSNSESESASSTPEVAGGQNRGGNQITHDIVEVHVTVANFVSRYFEHFM